MKKFIKILLYIFIFVMAVNFCIYFFTRSEYELTGEWKETVLDNYNEFIAETDGDPDKIPMIISTDQHGAISSDSEFYEYINSIVDWSKVSKIINLGDTVKLVYNPLELLSYGKATSCLPEDKRIEVIGNHDRFFVPTGKLVEKRFFKSPGAVYSPDRKAFVVEDPSYNVRYLIVDTKCFPYYYTGGKLFTEQADFIIDELSKTDSSDIVLLSHVYLFKDDLTDRYGDNFTASEYFIGSSVKDTDVKQSFIDMLAARKNKTSGVLVDSYGVSHPYDFSSCRGNFLMTLHGHHHTEGYETKDGITEFLFQSMTLDNKDDTEPLCFYFAYIDTQSNILRVWKNLPGYEPFEVKIG